MNYTIEIADICDINSILELYAERMKWFKDNNIKQWNKYLNNHPKSEFEEIINSKNYYIIRNCEEIIGGFELSTNSKDWKDDITSAYYIYKVVTKVGYKNVGDFIFEKCKEMAKLNNIYENHNFKLIRYGNNERYSFSLRECNVDE